MRVTVVLRIVSAVAALVAGYAHLKLYNDGYKDIPVGNIGKQFLLNAIGALLIALGLVLPLFITQLQRWVWMAAAAAGVAWGLTSLIAFFVARTDTGWFNFQDQPGFHPSPEAQMAVFSEIIVVVCCAAVLVIALVGRSGSSDASDQ